MIIKSLEGQQKATDTTVALFRLSESLHTKKTIKSTEVSYFMPTNRHEPFVGGSAIADLRSAAYLIVECLAIQLILYQLPPWF
jgi:hypothetical protein